MSEEALVLPKSMVSGSNYPKVKTIDVAKLQDLMTLEVRETLLKNRCQ
jgi:hypothetical protein